MPNDELDLVQSMAIARDTRGKSLPAQVADIASLALSRNRLTPAEYFEYRLYDDQLHNGEAKRQFIGESCYHTLIRNTCDIRWWALGQDKVLGHAVLAAHGVPVPTTHALYHPFRVFPGAPTLQSPEALAAFLRDGMPYPFFQKPVSGVSSQGVHLVRSYDADADALTLHDGSTVGVEAFCRRLDALEGENKGDGHLFQEVLTLHPELEKRVGPATSGVRVIVLIEPDGPHIVQAVWKIIGGDAIADNARTPGNLLADIDIDTGRVVRVVQGVGPSLTERPDHPGTGETLLDTVLPHWDAVTELVQKHAGIAHKVRFQGWDIAIGPDGPVVIEFNVGSSLELPQQARGEGFGTPRFERFVTWATEVNETPVKGIGRLFNRR